MEKEIKELKELINIKLEVCDTKHYPVLCKFKQLENGVKNIERMLVHYAMQERMGIESGLAHIELEFKEIMMSENLKLEEI